MVNPNRIKNYLFPEVSGNNAGRQITQNTDFVINGELLRMEVFSNFTGSVIVRQSGNNITFLNGTATSGTTKWETFSLSNTTGSFVTNSPLQFIISGLMSGTAIKAGPAQLIYR